MYEPKGIRRSHAKSRNGCKGCKSRRIKCDEQHPTCTNCIRRDIQCIYEPKKGAASNTRASGGTHSESTSSSSPESTSLLPDPTSSFPRLGTVGSTHSPMTFDLVSLELFHHYTICTARTLPCYQTSGHVLAMRAPRESMKYPFLLHTLFSLSSLQLHVQNTGCDSSTDYLALSRQHYTQSVASLVEVLTRKGSIADPGMAEPITWTNNLLTIYLLALPAHQITNKQSAPAPLEWLQVARDFLSRNTIYWLQSLARQNESYSLLTEDIMNPPSGEWLASRLAFPPDLETIHLPLSTWPQPEELYDPLVSESYRMAMERLRDSYAWSLRATHQWASILLWPALVPRAFYDLVSERRPRALLIFSYYCALISQFSDLWWVRDRGRSDIEALRNIVLQSDHSEWASHFEGPLKMTQRHGSYSEPGVLFIPSDETGYTTSMTLLRA